MWNRDFQVVEENAAGAFLVVGSAHGEGDSATATKDAIYERIATSSEPFPQRMVTTLEAAHAALDHMNSHDVWEWEQNGVEVVSTWIAENSAHIAWIGNCRAYHLRDERIVAVTKEHSMLSRHRDAQGPLTTEEERGFAYSHVVTRALGVATGNQPFELEVHPGSWSLLLGDKILLCSRGVYLGLTAAEISELCFADQAAKQLVTGAAKNTEFAATALVVSIPAGASLPQARALRT